VFTITVKSNPILISVIIISPTTAPPIMPLVLLDMSDDPDVDFVLLSGLNVDNVIATKYTN
jgi:hypothetical protein